MGLSIPFVKRQTSTLLNAAYPKKNPQSTAPEYKPNSSELSYLTYYAGQRAEKLGKLGRMLRARMEGYTAGGTSAGAPRQKAMAMITLAILKEFLKECRREIATFAKEAVAVIDLALGTRDFDLVGRASECFVLLAGAGVKTTSFAADRSFKHDYEGLVRRFAQVAGDAHDHRSAAKGIEALEAAILSPAFGGNEDNAEQIKVIFPALLPHLYHKQGVRTRDLTAASRRLDRNAGGGGGGGGGGAQASTPAHGADVESHDQGPDSLKIALMAQAALRQLFRQSNSGQVKRAMGLIVDWMDGEVEGEGEGAEAELGDGDDHDAQDDTDDGSATDPDDEKRQLQPGSRHARRAGAGASAEGRTSVWKDEEWCLWLVASVVGWTQTQYRLAIVLALLDGVGPSDGKAGSERKVYLKSRSILAMITRLLAGDYSLVGLPIMDVLTKLLRLLVGRVKASLSDPLLPNVVHCVSALGAHSYYPDQISDIVSELIVRIREPETMAGERISLDEKERETVMKAGLRCLVGTLESGKSAKPARFSSDKKRREKDHRGDRGNGDGDDGDDDDDTIESNEGGIGNGHTLVPNSKVGGIGTRKRVHVSVMQKSVPLLVDRSFGVRITYVHALLKFLEIEVPHYSQVRQAEERQTGVKYVVPTVGTSIIQFLNELHCAIFSLALSSSKPKRDGVAVTSLDYTGISLILHALVRKFDVDEVLKGTPMVLKLDAELNRVIKGEVRRGAAREVVIGYFDEVADRIDAEAVGKLSDKVKNIFPEFPLPPLGDLDAIPDSPPPFSAESTTEISAPTKARGVSNAAFDKDAVIAALQQCQRMTVAAGGVQELADRLDVDWSIRWAQEDSEQRDDFRSRARKPEGGGLLTTLSTNNLQAGRDRSVYDGDSGSRSITVHELRGALGKCGGGGGGGGAAGSLTDLSAITNPGASNGAPSIRSVEGGSIARGGLRYGSEPLPNRRTSIVSRATPSVAGSERERKRASAQVKNAKKAEVRRMLNGIGSKAGGRE